MLHTLTLCLAAAAVAGVDDPDRTLRVDPVELIGGSEVPGSERLALARGRYTYWFATPRSRAAFEADPQRYEIQLGGACARMGPLSGEGRTDLWAVHDGRLYIFASEACRRTFLVRADELLEADDPLPAWTPETRRRGRDLLERAVEAMGGAEAIDGVRTYAHCTERSVESGGTVYRVVDAVAIGFPDRFQRVSSWNDERWGSALTAADAFRFTADDRWAMAPSQRRAFEKTMSRDPLLVLRDRDAPGVLVSHVGSEEIEGSVVEHVAVARGGVTSTLGVDAGTGRVLSLTCRGRGPHAVFGRREVRYSDFREVGGLVLPFTSRVIFDGEPVEGSSRTLTHIAIDEPID